jgi:Icc-related predicted phosphoesterase
MKILEMSDLHLEFNTKFRIRNEVNADMLILAGDIFVAEYFTKTELSPKYTVAQGVREFFRIVSEEFTHVLYVLGNHEHYFSALPDTPNIIRDAIKEFPNIHLLNNEYLELEGIRFIGSTLWTDCLNGNPITMNLLSTYLNDFKLIKYKKKPYEKFLPRHSVTEHIVAKQFIAETTKYEGTCVVITHHGPSNKSIDVRYSGAENYHANAGYVSNLDEFILDRPNIKVWFHGHIHNNKDYMIGDTRVICNPHGYHTENLHDFNHLNLIEVA